MLVGLLFLFPLCKSYVGDKELSWESQERSNLVLCERPATRKIPRGTPFLTAYDIVLLFSLCSPDVHDSLRRAKIVDRLTNFLRDSSELRNVLHYRAHVAIHISYYKRH